MKVSFFITARLKSTRLPMKVIMDLNGKKVIEHLIERAKQVVGIDEIVLCTSTNPQDRMLVDIAKENNIYYYTGDEEDVVKRLADAGDFFGSDYFVSITADNPLFSVYHSNLIVNEIRKNEFDYIKSTQLPLGCATYGVRTKAFKTLCKVKDIIDTEIWGALIDIPDLFSVKEVKGAGKYTRPYRMTLDYKEDYEFFNHIYRNIPYKDFLNLYDVLVYLEKNEEIIKINDDCYQKQNTEDMLKKLKENIYNNKEKIREILNKSKNV